MVTMNFSIQKTLKLYYNPMRFSLLCFFSSSKIENNTNKEKNTYILSYSFELTKKNMKFKHEIANSHGN